MTYPANESAHHSPVVCSKGLDNVGPRIDAQSKRGCADDHKWHGHAKCETNNVVRHDFGQKRRVMSDNIQKNNTRVDELCLERGTRGKKIEVWMMEASNRMKHNNTVYICHGTGENGCRGLLMTFWLSRVQTCIEFHCPENLMSLLGRELSAWLKVYLATIHLVPKSWSMKPSPTLLLLRWPTDINLYANSMLHCTSTSVLWMAWVQMWMRMRYCTCAGLVVSCKP